LLALCGDSDAICPLAAATPAHRAWGHPDRELRVLPGYAHLDALAGPRAPTDVFGPAADWLSARRRLAWGPEWSPISEGAGG
jgi:alpha-beta hydrolase superfamily lysophospholipase